jgi:ribonuclease Z
MKSAFHHFLINPPFEDPGLYVLRRHERSALLFDLGDIRRLNPRQLLAIAHVFITHLHIDHFCGFDDLLRVCLGRPLTIHLYGPPGLISALSHKLSAYTWNLVHRYDAALTLTTTELHDGLPTLPRAQFRAQAAFTLEPLPPRSRDAEDSAHDASLGITTLMRDHRLRVRATTLDHHIPCLAFSVEEVTHVAIMKDRLRALGLPVGPWLQHLKHALLRADPDDALIPGPNGQPLSLGPLRALCAFTCPGPKLAYVTDIAFHDYNVARACALARAADVLFIESSFLAADADRAAARAHLTTHQAGTIARLASAKRVIPFHFSPRHLQQADQLYAEVASAFSSPPPTPPSPAVPP